MAREEFQIRFDVQHVEVVQGARVLTRVPWKEIRQIGFRSTNVGPWVDDHFIVLRTNRQGMERIEFSTEWVGAEALVDRILDLPDTLVPDEGTLANCAEARTTTVWPSEMSGMPI